MRHLSLFTGSGIGDLAAKEVGIITIAQCESDPCCQYALRKLWPEAYLFTDVHDVSAIALRERGLWPVDIISGGVPCQPTSLAGKGLGAKDARWLWPETLRVVAEVRPPWLVFENPLGFRSRGLDGILTSLEEMRYTCWPLVIPAYAAGLRHHRKRFWIVAHADHDGLPRIQDIPAEAEGRRRSATEPLAVPAWARGFGTLAEVPCFADGLVGGLLPSVRNRLLRVAGNAWVYPLARIIFQWIAETEKQKGAKRCC